MTLIYEKKIHKAPIIVLCIIIAAAIIIPYSIHARNENNYSKYCDLGDASMGDGRYSDAIVYFTNALEYKPDNNELKQKLERAGKLVKSKAAFEKGLKDSYDKHFDEAIKDFEAVDKADEERYKVAQEKIKQCRILYVNNFVNMAKSEMEKGNIEVAVSYLDKAIVEDPANATAVSLKSQYTLVLQQKAEDEAKKQLEEQKKSAKQDSKTKNQSSSSTQNQGTSTPANNESSQQTNQQTTQQTNQQTTQPQENQTTTP